MRYEKGRRDETRGRILEAAATRFRKDGIEAVGIKSLMGEVGLTHGGFYAHFGSRDGLVAAAVGEALQDTLFSLQKAVDEAPADRKLDAFIDAYLSELHRERIDRGCAGAALAPEVARQPLDARVRFAAGLKRLVDLLADQLPPGGSSSVRAERGYGVFSGLMGALQLARAVDDRTLSDAILRQGRVVARLLARQPW
jgi:TetR/AcrR family transcriptional repressor of nem operon